MTTRKALNAARMKERNHRRFLRELRTRPMTRSDLARRMGLTRAATSLIAEDLLSAGIVEEGPAPDGGRASAKALRWNPNFGHAGGVNLGRDSITVGLGDFCGNLLDRADFPTADCAHWEQALERAAGHLERMLRERDPAGRFLGIGVASPGPLDTAAGVILDPPGFGLMAGCPAVSWLRERFGCDVVLENDANALALAERSHGLADRCERFLELMVDMGVGASLILDGKLYRGPAGFGNGFGHTSIHLNGPRCACGNSGCVELYAAIPRIVAAARALDPRFDSWRAIVDRAGGGDPVALNVLRDEARYLAAVIVNASNVLDIQAVVLVGDHILYRPELLLAAVEEEVGGRIASRGARSVAIIPSRLSEGAKLLCCTNLVVEECLERPWTQWMRGTGSPDSIQ